MTTTTDVRAWLRDQGHDVPQRGAIRRELMDEYERAHAHPTVSGEVVESDYPDPGPADVTEASPPPDPAPRETAPEEEGRPKGTPAGKLRERAPRKVTAKASRKAPGRTRFRDRLTGFLGGGKAGRPKHARVSLSDFAEETWEDLAWLASPVPPLAKILAIQAPYAGAVVDAEIKGTPADAILQPVARYSGTLRGLNGLIGPPMITAMICATGAVDERGNYDARTQMLFQTLRYSLLQMVKVSDVHADVIAERAQAGTERMRAVDAIITSLFGPAPGTPPPGPDREETGPVFAAASPGSQNGYRYPEPPPMDGTGADPGRM